MGQLYHGAHCELGGDGRIHVGYAGAYRATYSGKFRNFIDAHFGAGFEVGSMGNLPMYYMFKGDSLRNLTYPMFTLNVGPQIRLSPTVRVITKKVWQKMRLFWGVGMRPRLHIFEGPDKVTFDFYTGPAMTVLVWRFELEIYPKMIFYSGKDELRINGVKGALDISLRFTRAKNMCPDGARYDVGTYKAR